MKSILSCLYESVLNVREHFLAVWTNTAFVKESARTLWPSLISLERYLAWRVSVSVQSFSHSMHLVSFQKLWKNECKLCPPSNKWRRKLLIVGQCSEISCSSLRTSYFLSEAGGNQMLDVFTAVDRDLTGWSVLTSLVSAAWKWPDSQLLQVYNKELFRSFNSTTLSFQCHNLCGCVWLILCIPDTSLNSFSRLSWPFQPFWNTVLFPSVLYIISRQHRPPKYKTLLQGMQWGSQERPWMVCTAYRHLEQFCLSTGLIYPVCRSCNLLIKQNV